MQHSTQELRTTFPLAGLPVQVCLRPQSPRRSRLALLHEEDPPWCTPVRLLDPPYARLPGQTIYSNTWSV